MALFLGEFETKIDAKHRLAIGSMFREQINPAEDGSDYVLILGTNRHLWVYPSAYYRRLLGTLKRSPLPTREAAALNVYYGMAREVKPDTQGRIVIPPKLLERAAITDDVAEVAAGDHLEIWPSREWDEYVTKRLENYDDMLYEAAERLNAEQQARQDA